MKGLVPFTLHPFQKRFAASILGNRYLIGKKFRNDGFTTVSIVYGLWDALFHLDRRVGFLANNQAGAEYLNQFLSDILHQLPEWLRGEFHEQNKYRIKFSDCGSSITFISSEEEAVRVRGCKFDLLFIDEAAYHEDLHEAWRVIFPSLACGGSVIATSTTKKLKYGENNWFFETICGAEEGTNSFVVFTVDHSEHPDYSNPDFVELLKKNLGDEGYHIEVLMDWVFEGEPPVEEKKQPDTPEGDPAEYCVEYERDFLTQIKEGLPAELVLSLDGERLTVNGVPTKIEKKVIEMAFVGLSELASYDKALTTVSKLVSKKLKALF